LLARERQFEVAPLSGIALARDRSTISSSLARAPAINSPTNAVSGMFFQYFFGISLVIALIFTRAGLKMDA
jgi:hypothetical protein